MLTVNAASGFGSGRVASVVTSAFTANTGVSPSTTSHTFSGVALGVAASDRIIIVGLATNDYSNTYVSGTVAGETLSQVATSPAGNNHTTFLLQAAVPTGTTGDIFVDYSSTSTHTQIGVWAMYGANSTVSDTANAIDADPISADIDCPAGGAIFGIVRMGSSGSPTGVWSNLTEDFDNVVDAVGVTGAHDNFDEEQSGRTIHVTQTGGNNENRIVLASYGPA